MHTAPLETPDWKPSALGFFGDAPAAPSMTTPEKLNAPLATAMIRYAIDHGVNYVDTAWPYHKGHGRAFPCLLADGYRAKVSLATQLPTWLIQSLHDDCDTYLNRQPNACRPTSRLISTCSIPVSGAARPPRLERDRSRREAFPRRRENPSYRRLPRSLRSLPGNPG